MRELTIEHIAPYLPYDLYLKSDKWIEKIVGYEYQANGQHRAQMLIKKHDSRITYWTPELRYIKPVLHPMSDFFEEIIIDGNKFFAYEDLEALYDFTEQDYHKSSWRNYPCEVVKTLIEWHFDVFSLIDRGLAIDVNDLEENPYH